jgi:hypothetical protein
MPVCSFWRPNQEGLNSTVYCIILYCEVKSGKLSCCMNFPSWGRVQDQWKVSARLLKSWQTSSDVEWSGIFEIPGYWDLLQILPPTAAPHVRVVFYPDLPLHYLSKPFICCAMCARTVGAKHSRRILVKSHKISFLWYFLILFESPMRRRV